MDEIYRFRSADRLLGRSAELAGQTIYFAESSTLNDPMEAIRVFVWRGDAVAWRNLFRHYVYCLHHIYLLLRLSEPDDCVGASDIPINARWDDPLSQDYADIANEIWRDLDERFDLAGVASRVDSLRRAVRSHELEFYLSCIHAHAVAAIQSRYIEHGLQEPGPTDVSLSAALPSSLHAFFDILEQLKPEEDFIRISFEVAQQFIAKRRIEAKLKVIRPSETGSERSRSFLLVDFPHAYVQRLSLAVGPKWYASCFTESYGNSAQWAHYARRHSGVCLVFAVDNDGHGPSLKLHEGAQGVRHDDPTVRQSHKALQFHFERLHYADSLGAVDFFASISRLPEASTLTVWFTDDDGNRSSVAGHMAPHADINRWRDVLWSEYRRDICTKTKEWAYEKEHRLVRYSLLGDTLSDDQLTMTYEFPALKGIVFGINTSDYHKLTIIDLIRRKCSVAGRSEFDFRQAYYSMPTGQIKAFPLNLDLTP